MSQPRTFVITGVSSGLGRAFAEAALAAGHTVAGTVRRTEDAEAFAALAPGRASAYLLDVTDNDAVATTLAGIETTVGAIDVLVVNAGFGLEGTLEESTMADVRRQFDVNVFGAVATIKAVLPGMRRRRDGHIVVITSVGGLLASPTLSIYHGSKFAMEGITASLAAEIADFGIKVTAIEPGAFRTDWSGRSMQRVARTIADYDTIIDPIRSARAAYSGHQPGDPNAAGAALLKLIDMTTPPTRLLLGSDALHAVRAARHTEHQGIERLAQLSTSTDAAPNLTTSTPTTAKEYS